MKRNWREGSLAGDREVYVEKPLETGISFHRSLDGKPGGRLVYWGLGEMYEGGSRDGASLSEDTPWRGPRGGPSLEILKLMLRKALDMGISLHRRPFRTEGTWNLEGGSYTRDSER